MSADAFNEMNEIEREEYTMSGQCAHCQRKIFTEDGAMKLPQGVEILSFDQAMDWAEDKVDDLTTCN